MKKTLQPLEEVVAAFREYVFAQDAYERELLSQLVPLGAEYVLMPENDCDTRDRIFGDLDLRRVARRYGIKLEQNSAQAKRGR